MTQPYEHDFTDSHLIRHCRYQQTDKRGFPTETAFMLRKNEEYLSFNWMEKICDEFNISPEQDLRTRMESSVRSLEQSFPLCLTTNQLWAILHCNDIRDGIAKVTNRLPTITLDSNATNKSHTQVRYNRLHNDAVAGELLRRLKADNVFAVEKPHSPDVTAQEDNK